MNGKNPDPERIDEENPEWTPEDIKRARPAGEVLPELIGQKATDELLRQSRERRKATPRNNPPSASGY